MVLVWYVCTKGFATGKSLEKNAGPLVQYVQREGEGVPRWAIEVGVGVM